MTHEDCDLVRAQALDLDELAHWVGKRQIADSNIEDLVAACRSVGCSWERIAEALGTTRQAAWERYYGKVTA